MKEIIGDLCHDKLVETVSQTLAFDETNDYVAWRAQVKEKFYELLGFAEIEKNGCPLSVEIEEITPQAGYIQIRFTFESERNSIVPCYLLIPDTGKEKYPVVITLQGHTTGFHNSINVAKYEIDKKWLPKNAFAIQAVQNGYAALAIEQRAFGERRTSRYPWDSRMCAYTFLTAVHLGRTIAGERAWDVSRAIDALVAMANPKLDLDKIILAGHSGGGTATFYAACYDERIKIAVPCGAFCSYKTSILAMYHCACNYIPKMYNYFEMGELSCLVAPRTLLVVAGSDDPIFPLSGVESEYVKAKKIYEKAGVADKCRLIVTQQGHEWGGDKLWEAIRLEIIKRGW
ncbi:MAG: acetylxylan esterase [Clostridia bacterium]|nr:acetylxylan esterase [Clostridia bacterium]